MAGAKTTLHLCSACQHIMVTEGIWLSWEEFMQKQRGLKESHTLCEPCSSQLHGRVSLWSP